MSINFARFDLNLLRLFLIVFETQSVSKAATIMGLSQPAASSALNRLRERLNNPLFVRGKGLMVPTQFALEIAPRVKASLQALENALAPPEPFDPATTSHVLRLSLSGLGEALLLPTIAKQILSQAPGLRFRNLSIARGMVGQALQNGEIDLAIGMLDIQDRGIEGADLFQETYSAIASTQHFQADTIDIKACKLVLAAPEATYASDIEKWVSDNDLSDKIVMRLRHFGGVRDLLSAIDAIAIVPTQYADRLIASGTIREVARLSDLKERAVRMIWHSRTTADPASVWIREQILSWHRHGGIA